MQADPTKTRPARRAAPKLSRSAASVFSGLAQKTRYADPSLCGHWPDIAGGEIAQLCRPGRLTGAAGNRTLEVHVPSGASAAKLQMLLEELRARVNRYLGPGGVARIIIKHAVASAPLHRDENENSPLGGALASFRAAINRKNDGK